VRFDECLVDQETFTGLLPLCAGTGLFASNVGVDAILWYPKFAYHSVEGISTVSLQPHWHHNGPVLVVAEELSVFISSDRLDCRIQRI